MSFNIKLKILKNILFSNQIHLQLVPQSFRMLLVTGNPIIPLILIRFTVIQTAKALMPMTRGRLRLICNWFLGYKSRSNSRNACNNKV